MRQVKITNFSVQVADMREYAYGAIGLVIVALLVIGSVMPPKAPTYTPATYCQTHPLDCIPAR